MKKSHNIPLIVDTNKEWNNQLSNMHYTWPGMAWLCLLKTLGYQIQPLPVYLVSNLTAAIINFMVHNTCPFSALVRFINYNFNQHLSESIDFIRPPSPLFFTPSCICWWHRLPKIYIGVMGEFPIPRVASSIFQVMVWPWLSHNCSISPLHLQLSSADARYHTLSIT